MSRILLDREHVEASLHRCLDLLFALPEVEGIRLGGVVIGNNASRQADAKEALNRSYHDCYSDSDLTLLVRLPGNIAPADYVNHPHRLGIHPDRCLGFLKTEDSGIYRFVLKDGTRYDLGFEFSRSGPLPEIAWEPEPERYNDPGWPMEKVDAFWFIMIQALGKLYRRDHLIGSHLANMCVNETLVQQMVFRDRAHGTTHHRYGFGEELLYRKYEGQNPFTTGGETFDLIAGRLYAAALAYDELTKGFYPEYEPRSSVLFDIWQCYHDNRRS